MTVSSPFEISRLTERRRVLRHLLVQPLILARADPELFAAAVRHRAELTAWFAEYVGWVLVVEPGAGHVRLLKRPAHRHATRPARAPGREAFDRRRYALLCLALAALDGTPGQTTLARLAEAVRELSLEERELPPFDPQLQAERRAFVDVLRLLTELGLLVLRDGDAESYARRGDGDALYDVHERLLGHLLAAPLPPALAGTPARMAEEERPQTEEGERHRARQAIFRALLDDPVVYYEDLDPGAQAWLEHGRAFLYERLEQDVGVAIERRAEGLAAVDADGTLTDTTFPEGNSTVKHAALLLCEWLADRARTERLAGQASAGVEWAELVDRVTALRAEHGERWSKEHEPGAAGSRRLALEALAVLEGFGLAEHTGERWRARPAAARFAAAPATP
jgi:uncharacterized protein (TIGR02678 family)